MTVFRKSTLGLKDSAERTAEKKEWTDDGKRARHKESAANNSWAVRNANYEFGDLKADNAEKDAPKSALRKMDTRRLRRFQTQRLYIRAAGKVMLIAAVIAAALAVFIIPLYLLSHALHVKAQADQGIAQIRSTPTSGPKSDVPLTQARKNVLPHGKSNAKKRNRRNTLAPAN
jgi:hypothetical protein